MIFPKSARALLIGTVILGISAPAYSQNAAHNPWAQAPQTTDHHGKGKQSAQDDFDYPQAQGKSHGSHSNRPYRYEPSAPKYGYNKPKNPYNNGIHSPNHKFYRGGQLPAEYRGDRGQRYVIVDWHTHDGLYAPPPGTRWTYIDGRYILATIATGIIYNIIYGN